MTLHKTLALLVLLSGLAGSAFAINTPAPAPDAAAEAADGVNPLDAAAGDIVASALSLIGTPYVYGGSDPEGGLDCSGLVGYVYNMAGYTLTLPRSSQEIFDLKLPSVEQKDLVAGDLLFFRVGKSKRINHVVIYVGNGRFVHAPNSKSMVRMDKLNSTYWQRYYAGARRVLNALPETTR